MGKSKMKIARNLDELHILTIIALNSKEIVWRNHNQGIYQ